MSELQQPSLAPELNHHHRARRRWFALAILLLLLLALQVASQTLAYLLGYQPILGNSWLGIYPPWLVLTFYSTWYGWEPWLDERLLSAGSVGCSVAALGLLLLAIAQIVLSHSSYAAKTIHGSARWATRDDLMAAGLLPPAARWWHSWWPLANAATESEGVYVGGWRDERGHFHYLRHNGAEHVLTYAPTRSGKGVGLVVPTLLSWPESCVITDLKGELWALTAGWRKSLPEAKVLRFEPAAVDSVHWNPLNELHLDSPTLIGEVQNLVTMLVDPDGRGLDSHWQKTAFALLVGVILYELFRPKKGGEPASLPSVDRLLTFPGRPLKNLWHEMQLFNLEGCPHCSIIQAAARDMIDRPAEEGGSVVSTAKAYLAIYRDPVIAANLQQSDFALTDLMHHSAPVSLYIITQPSDKGRLKPLVRILITMLVRQLAQRLDFEDGQPKANYRHKLLLLLDEFPSLGKLEILQESLAFIAAYGIKCYLICQDLNQLKSRESGYGHDEQITSNCHIQNAFPPNRLETAEHPSKLTGQTTVIKEQITTSGRRSALLLGQVSTTFQEVQRPLLTADECLRLAGAQKGGDGSIIKPGAMIISVAGFPAIYGEQPLYFLDRTFKERAKIRAPTQSDTIIKPAALEANVKMAQQESLLKLWQAAAPNRS